MRNAISLLALAFILTGCAESTPPDANPTPHDFNEGPGLFSGESGNILDAFNGNRNRKNNGSSDGSGTLSSVNVHLWRAALDVVSVLPLTQVDSAGGVIITDWAEVPNTPSERLRVNVALLNRSLTSSALKVNVFKQQNVNGTWQNLPADTATARQLENAILTKARVLSLQK